MAVISNGTTLIDAALDSGVATGDIIHIKTLTASSSANLSFVHGSSSVVLDAPSMSIYLNTLIFIGSVKGTINI